LEQFQCVGDVLLQLAHAFHLRRQLVPLAHQLLRGGGIIPEVGILGARVQLGQASFGDIPVKDASSAARPTA
jgi:hypothetical protein